MKWLFLRTSQCAGFLLGLIIVAALSLWLVAPARAATPPETITASFDPSTAALTVRGDDQSNIIVIGRDAAGTILVNGGAVPITGGVSTVANTSLIEVFGQGKNDQLSLDETNGPLPNERMRGGGGIDTVEVTGRGDSAVFK